MIVGIATTIALALLGLAMLAAVIRILLGPTLADRILGLDTITVLGIGLIAVFAVRTGLALYADLAVGLALLGFVATAAFARYLLSRGEP
jgi:multicomponent Na+:H+ antiporter subunit F